MPTRKKIDVLINQYLKEKRAFVFYRKCKSDKVLSFLQKDELLYTTSNYKESGFVMAPFDSNNPTILFPLEKCERSSYTFPQLIMEKKDIDWIPIKHIGKGVYSKLISETVDFIEAGNANKVVISRVIDKPISSTDVGKVFLKLLNLYSDALVYIWHHPDLGLWMGATPEKLVHLDKDTFSTISLAGTQIYKEDIVWDTKEREEQQWVTDFIVDQLLPIVDSLQVSVPKTSKAGHLAHIKSKITGDISKLYNLESLINRLHPTPAVCGTPRNTAKTYILQNEVNERHFYTGFLGEINLDMISDLYVNLRCMKIDGAMAKIYVGGGITKDSVPEKEWEETVHKSKILGELF